ncbi:MAG: AtpZ/AtpI family protein [Candidatus Saccharibacteria bacterium]
MTDKKFQKQKRKFDDFIKYSNLAFEMIAIMAVGVFAGIKLDQWLKMDFPAFTLGLMILSVIGAIYHVMRKFL